MRKDFRDYDPSLKTLKTDLELFNDTVDLDEVVDRVIKENLHPIEAARLYNVRPSDVLLRLPLQTLIKFSGTEGHEPFQDHADAYLQLLVPRALDRLAQVLSDPTLDAKAVLLAVRDVLDRRSYSGVKRSAVAVRTELSPNTLEALLAAERMLTSTEQPKLIDLFKGGAVNQ